MKENTYLNYQEIILIDKSYLTSLIKDINAATTSIDIECYIFSNDNVGRQVTNALCQAASRGVKIRVLVDGIGTPYWNFENEMEHAGIETRVYHPIPWMIRKWNDYAHPKASIISNFFHSLANLNTRNHRKTCIIDKRVAYIGSANITDDMIDTNSKPIHWRDTSVKFSDIPTYDIQYAFDRAWGSVSLRNRVKNAFSPINPEPLFRLNYSRRRRRKLYKSTLTQLSTAKNRIWITNAYFLPENRLLNALIRASQKGVNIGIILPEKSDVMISSLASKTFYSLLLKNDISIYEYSPGALHAKVLIIDDWYCVGSSNFNTRSIRHDLEVDAIIRTDNAKKILDQQFKIDISHSKKIKLDDLKKQPIFQYIFGYLILIIRYWL